MTARWVTMLLSKLRGSGASTPSHAPIPAAVELQLLAKGAVEVLVHVRDRSMHAGRRVSHRATYMKI